MSTYIFGRLKLPYGQFWLFKRHFERSEIIYSIPTDGERHVSASFPDHCITVESAPESDPRLPWVPQAFLRGVGHYTEGASTGQGSFLLAIY